MSKAHKSLLEKIEQIPEALLPELKQKNYWLYVAWTEVCHLAGSLTLLGISHLLSIYTAYNIPLLVCGPLVVWMTYQEFYRHPKLYNQRLSKGILDWLFWIVPFVLYLTFI